MFNLIFFLPYYEFKATFFFFFWCFTYSLRQTSHKIFVKESGKRCLRGNLTWKNIKWVIAIKPSTSEAHSALSYIRTGDHTKASTARAALPTASIQGGR